MPPETISHYRILHKIGGGGMGVVFEAEDLELGRHVALKFLPEELQRDRAALERFRLEARTASSLNHPNICVIHEIGAAEDGRLFIVMELMQGETLKQRIQGGRLSVSEILEYGVQIAEALAAAHAKGIVHRDIKPANIFVNESGQIKLLDFGLAKQAVAAAASSDANTASGADDPLTGPGTTLGTLGYMSPEQALGKNIDARSDLFSTGVVLYEMATGVQPFRGDTGHAVVDSLLHDHPKTASELNPKLPVKLDQVIFKTLEKDPAVRCQSAAELKADLLRLKRDLEGRKSEPTAAFAPVRKRARRFLWLALAALIGLIGAAVVLFYKPGRSSSQITSIAVLPLANVPANPDTDYVSDGISEGLINALSELPQLRVMSRNSVLRYKSRDVDAATAGRDLGVQAVLTGQVRQRGNEVAVSLELVDTANNSHLWGADYSGTVNDLLSLQSDITGGLAKKLRGNAAESAQPLMARGSTSNPAAYQLYLKGRYFIEKYTKDGIDKGVQDFQQAIKLDPNYALAYEGLSYAYWIEDDLLVAPHDIEPQARAGAQRALQIDDSLASAHTDLGLVYFGYDFDWSAAEREFKRAIELQPNYAEAHEYFAWLLAVEGRSSEALAENRRAVDADPLSPEANFTVSQTLSLLLDRTDDAIEQANKALELDPNYYMAHATVGAAYAQKGDFPRALGELQKATEEEPNVYQALAYSGRVYALSGDRARAGQVLQKLAELSKTHYVAAYYYALIYDGLGEKQQAIAALEKGYDDRSIFLTFVPGDPAFQDLHSEPRFQSLLKRLGLSVQQAANAH